MLQASAERAGEGSKEGVLQTVADSSARLTPDMLIAIIEKAQAHQGQESDVAAAVVDRMGDNTIASFVAGNVAKQNGASERLAQALQLLVPDIERKERLIDLAKHEAEKSPLGQQAGFQELWESAANMLASYSDESFVSAEYARELTSAQKQSLDVERVVRRPAGARTGVEGHGRGRGDQGARLRAPARPAAEWKTTRRPGAIPRSWSCRRSRSA